MDPVIAATTFTVIFLAELPDKTVLACIVLASRFRPAAVFCGAALAFAAQVGVAIAAGGLLSLLPRQAIEMAASVVFLGGAIFVWHQAKSAANDTTPSQPDRKGPLRAAAVSFAVVFAAEFGDFTQILTVSLQARFHQPAAVAAGAVAGLWLAAALGMIGGRGLLKIIPMAWLHRGVAVLMMVLATVSLVSALR
jgi:Ca2+/H+ antiporter, TMEM165/GDT1 family